VQIKQKLAEVTARVLLNMTLQATAELLNEALLEIERLDRLNQTAHERLFEVLGTVGVGLRVIEHYQAKAQAAAHQLTQDLGDFSQRLHRLFEKIGCELEENKRDGDGAATDERQALEAVGMGESRRPLSGDARRPAGESDSAAGVGGAAASGSDTSDAGAVADHHGR
jgi:hypothetical protein